MAPNSCPLLPEPISKLLEQDADGRLPVTTGVEDDKSGRSNWVSQIDLSGITLHELVLPTDQCLRTNADGALSSVKDTPNLLCFWRNNF